MIDMFSATFSVFSSGDLILHAAVSITLTVLLSFLKIPTLFLSGLHTYIHPDDVNPNNASSGSGVRAAIRRPGSVDAELKPRKKSKEKFEFDENKAQIFRLKLSDGHLQSRIYFKEFNSAFNLTFIAISCLLVHRFLGVDNDSGFLRNGSVIPVLLGCVGVCRIFILFARAYLERSASKRLEKQLSVLWGILGFFLALSIVFHVIPRWVLDFSMESLDGFAKFFIAVSMGCIAGLLYIPAVRNTRAFWLGTDQIRCNLSIISCGWFARMLLYANYLLVVFTSLLWISPLTELLINKTIEGRKSHSVGRSNHSNELVGYMGIPRSDFDKFRLSCLLITGIMQIVGVRSNVQMFLNEAVLCWYQRLHASKVPDLDYSRAKVFLHNHYVCLVVLQFFAPAALVLLFLALCQINDNFVANFPWMCSLFPCSILVKEVAVFVAWWIVFVWAIFTSVLLALYRRGILYIS